MPVIVTPGSEVKPVKIGDVLFDGNRGHVLPPRKQLDYYTRYGDNKVYMQLVNVSSQLSSIDVWTREASLDAVGSKINGIRDMLGRQNSITLGSGWVYQSAYVMDFTYTIRQGPCYWLLEMTLQIIADEREV
jgi:hypothetical protein